VHRHHGKAFLAALLFAGLVGPTPAQAQAADLCSGYKQPRIKIEGQSWWMAHSTDLTQTSHHGHLHAEACVPHLQRVNGRFRVDVTVKLHDNHGKVWKIASLLTHRRGKTQTRGRRNLSFKCLVPGDCQKTFRVYVNSAAAPVDGLMDVRLRPVADTPGVPTRNNMAALIRFSINAQNGKVERSHSEAGGVVGIGKYDQAGYTGCGLAKEDARDLDLTKSGTWTPFMAHTSTGDKQSRGWNITRSFVSIDPNIHAGSIGTVVRDVSNGNVGERSIDGVKAEVSINTAALANGWHKLMCLSQARTNSVLGPKTITGVGVFHFYVQNP
jgi:hypothetical protein